MYIYVYKQTEDICYFCITAQTTHIYMSVFIAKIFINF